MSSSGNTTCAVPTFGGDVVWGQTITSCTGRSPPGPHGWMPRRTPPSLTPSSCAKSASMCHNGGFRTQVVMVFTTLLDAHEFPKEELASLYRQRWQAELNLRS